MNAPSFAEFFAHSVSTMPVTMPPGYGVCRDRGARRCTICHASRLRYEQEILLKDEALAAYFHDRIPEGLLRPLLPSPLGRRYRGVSKRRAEYDRGHFAMGLIGQDARGRYTAFTPGTCDIEHDDHAPVFALLEDFLSRPPYKPLAQVLRYLTVKGEGEKRILMLTMDEFRSDLTRLATRLSQKMVEALPGIAGVILIRDQSEGQYYQGGQDSTTPQDYRKLFGTDILYHRVGDHLYSHHALAFTQVNHSILPSMLDTARAFLADGGGAELVDLYCGYGLFTIALASGYARATGVEMSHRAVESAERNAQRAGIDRVRFLSREIGEESLPPILRRARFPFDVLLDPPRNGCSEGVVDLIADFGPRRILHLFCNIELVGRDLRHWQSLGYRPVFVQPFDSFPGTAHVEVMVGLEGPLEPESSSEYPHE